MLTGEEANCEHNKGNRNDNDHKPQHPPPSLKDVHDIYSVEGSTKKI